MGRPLPLTVEKVDSIGATLRAGGCISHKNYLSRAFSEAERANAIASSAAVRRVIKDASRACARGLGGLRQKSGLPLDQLHNLPSGPAPWAKDGPLWPRDALVIGSLFLVRELELAGAAAQRLSPVPRLCFEDEFGGLPERLETSGATAREPTSSARSRNRPSRFPAGELGFSHCD